MIVTYHRAVRASQGKACGGAQAQQRTPPAHHLYARDGMDDVPIIHGWMEGACSELDKTTQVSAPELLQTFSLRETIAASMLASGNRRVLLPYSSPMRSITRLVDRFLPGKKKAPQLVLSDSLRCLASLFLPRGGQNDQQPNSTKNAGYYPGITNGTRSNPLYIMRNRVCGSEPGNCPYW